MPRCPGQDQRFWKPEDIFEINCPGCGTAIEFWKDEPKLKCLKCGELIVNPKLDLGCAEWCKYAKECLGVSAVQGSGILCNKLIEEMRKAFAGDRKQISRTLNILKYAEQIQLAEGGDPLVVKAAAILHDIATDNTQSRPSPAAAETSQKIEDLAVVREILVKYGIETEPIEHICRIITSHHSEQDTDSIELKIIQDAVQLVNFDEQFAADADKEKIKKHIDGTFKTEKGRQLATELLANPQN
ncbi:MAG TPA: HD domain-containing protein [Phycisphaerales bacterium]|nr:HD domain-containing protein [Phycisphaerales bacterium]